MSTLRSTDLLGCNSIPSFIAGGTRMFFARANAPASWTRDTRDLANNRLLRVISSGDGGNVGGTRSPILNNVVPSHSHNFNTGQQNRNHYHGGQTENITNNHSHVYNRRNRETEYGNRSSRAAFRARSNINTGLQNSNHQHRFNTNGISIRHEHSGSTNNGSSQTNWDPRYVNIINCYKNNGASGG